MANLDNVKRYIAAGFARMDFHRLDSKGLPAGITGTVPPGANGVAAGRITAVTNMNINIPAATLTPVPGDNALQGTFPFPSDAPRGFDVQFSEDDFQDRQAFQNIIPRDIGSHSFAGRDIIPYTVNNLMFIGLSNAKARTTGVKGLGMYAGVFSTRAELTVRGRNGFVNRGAALMEGTISLNAMDSYPWGESFKIDVEGYLEDFIEDWTHKYPVTCHRWTGGSGVTVFNFGETPASTDLNDILIYTIDANGVVTRKTTGVTISTTARTATFLAAPDALDIVAWYGYVAS